MQTITTTGRAVFIRTSVATIRARMIAAPTTLTSGGPVVGGLDGGPGLSDPVSPVADGCQPFAGDGGPDRAVVPTGQSRRDRSFDPDHGARYEAGHLDVGQLHH